MPQGIGQTGFWVARGSGMHSEVVHLHPSSIPKPIRKSDTDGKNVDFETVEDKRNKSVVSIMVKEFKVLFGYTPKQGLCRKRTISTFVNGR